MRIFVLMFMLLSIKFFNAQDFTFHLKKTGSFGDFMIFLLKGSLGFSVLIIGFGFISVIVNLIIKAIVGNRKELIMIFVTILSLLCLYFYAFLGSFYYELYYVYSSLFEVYFVTYALCVIGILLWSAAFIKELKKERENLQETYSPEMDIESDHLNSILKIKSLSGFWMILISFVVFSIYPSLVDIIFWGASKYIPNLWLE